MSFILDALRKSEAERQQHGHTAMAEFPIGRRQRMQHWWMYALSALLLLNLIVLAVVLMRKPANQVPQFQHTPMKSAPSESTLRTPSTTTARSMNTDANIARAPATVPADEPPAVDAPASNALRDVAAPPQVEYDTVPRSEMENANAAVPPLDGPTLVRRIDDRSDDAPTTSATMPAPTIDPNAIHLDLHVYSKNPKDRFVMINMHRYTEGETMPSGVTVEQITPTGVVLYRNGQRFDLQR